MFAEDWSVSGCHFSPCSLLWACERCRSNTLSLVTPAIQFPHDTRTFWSVIHNSNLSPGSSSPCHPLPSSSSASLPTQPLSKLSSLHSPWTSIRISFGFVWNLYCKAPTYFFFSPISLSGVFRFSSLSFFLSWLWYIQAYFSPLRTYVYLLSVPRNKSCRREMRNGSWVVGL